MPPGLGLVVAWRGVLSALAYLALATLALAIGLVVRPILEATGQGLSNLVRRFFDGLGAR
jgi:hypothetical protein